MIKQYGNYRLFPTEEEVHSEKAITETRMEMLDFIKETCEYCDVKGIKSTFPIYGRLGEGYTIGWKVAFTLPGKDPPREVIETPTGLLIRYKEE